MYISTLDKQLNLYARYTSEELVDVFGARGVRGMRGEEGGQLVARLAAVVHAAGVPQPPHAAALAHVQTGLHRPLERFTMS